MIQTGHRNRFALADARDTVRSFRLSVDGIAILIPGDVNLEQHNFRRHRSCRLSFLSSLGKAFSRDGTNPWPSLCTSRVYSNINWRLLHRRPLDLNRVLIPNMVRNHQTIRHLNGENDNVDVDDESDGNTVVDADNVDAVNDADNATHQAWDRWALAHYALACVNILTSVLASVNDVDSEHDN